MNEKLISEFMNLGCTNRINALIILQVYLELCEVKKYWDIECEYSTTLKRLYIKAKKCKSEPTSVFLPYPASEELSFTKILQLLTLSEEKSRSIYLVLVSSDSTCVYYQLSDGLIEPTDTSAKHLKENKQDILDANLKKYRDILEQSALYGIPITINKEEKANSGCSKTF